MSVTLAKPLPIAPRLIVVDETEHWDFETCPHAELIDRIEAVYLYDANVRTHLCSFDSAYWYEPLYTRAVYKSGPVAGRTDDEVDDWIIAANSENEGSYSLYGPIVAELALPDFNWRKEGYHNRDEGFEAVHEDCVANWQI